MFACLYNGLTGRSWKKKIDVHELEQLFETVDQENDSPLTISFYRDGRFDKVVMNAKTLVVDYLYENQLAINFHHSRLLQKIMEHVDPRYSHSRKFFSSRINSLWVNHVVEYFRNAINTEEYRQRSHILRFILFIYSTWDLEYRSYRIPNMIDDYQFQFSTLHNTFSNQLGNVRTLEEIIQGLVFYQDIGIGKGLYQSSFYCTFLVTLMKEIIYEIYIINENHILFENIDNHSNKTNFSSQSNNSSHSNNS